MKKLISCTAAAAYSDALAALYSSTISFSRCFYPKHKQQPTQAFIHMVSNRGVKNLEPAFWEGHILVALLSYPLGHHSV